MKFTAEIRNIDTQEKHTIETPDTRDAQTAHKFLFMNTLANNEEIVRLFDLEGHLAFEDGKGFLA